MGNTVLILGGGVGGLVAANELQRLLPASGGHRIVLVENARHAFAPSFLWLMTGDRRPEQIQRDVRQLVRPGIELVLAEVQAINLAGHQVQTSAGVLNYDYLILALGAELAPDVIPGLAEGAHTFYTLDGAMKVRDALQGFAGGTVAVVVSALPYKCPGAPHEGAMLIADVLRRRGVKERSICSRPSPNQPVAGPASGRGCPANAGAQGGRLSSLAQLATIDPRPAGVLRGQAASSTTCR
jgi:sulfide:quinone oxidoreductase